MVKFQRAFLWVPAALCTLILTSCSKSQHQEMTLAQTGAVLEGSVKLGDTLIPYGLVMVTSSAGQATGKIDPGTGNYKVENVPIGEITLAVNTDAGAGDFRSLSMQGMANKDKGQLKPMVNVPKKYMNPTESGLKFTTQAGVNKHDIQLSK